MKNGAEKAAVDWAHLAEEVEPAGEPGPGGLFLLASLADQ